MIGSFEEFLSHVIFLIKELNKKHLRNYTKSSPKTSPPAKATMSEHLPSPLYIFLIKSSSKSGC